LLLFLLIRTAPKIYPFSDIMSDPVHPPPFYIEGNADDVVDDDLEAPPAPPRGLRRSRTAHQVSREMRDQVAQEYLEESRMLMKSRRRWKVAGDLCEALSKGLAGIGTVLAYAASAIKDQPATDILAFTSGFVGTIGLTLFAYSSYAVHESRQRTQELNALLQIAGVTPMPDVATNENPSSAD
jgi:hypothetical protein